jgi:hypothetical protein
MASGSAKAVRPERPALSSAASRTYVAGQTIAGYVVRILEAGGAVEVRN